MNRLARDLLRLGAEIVPIVLVALLVFHLIRSHVLERYLVPSASMEPTLVGDPQRGDIVLVDKLRSGLPQRFDLAVLRNRFDPTRDHIVKRVISTGDEWVWIHEGDVYVADAREQIRSEGPLAKDPVLEREQLVTHFDSVDATPAQLHRYWRRDPVWSVLDGEPALEVRSGFEAVAGALEPLRPAARAARLEQGKAHPAGYLSTLGPITGTFIDRRGVRRGQDVLTRDNGFEVRFRSTSECAAVHAVYEYRGHYYGIVYERGGRLQRSFDGQCIPDSAVPCAPWGADGVSVDFRFGYLDGRLFAVVAGQTVLLERVALQDDLAPDGLGSDNLLHLAFVGPSAQPGAAAGVRVRIDSLRVFHDVYYTPIQTPLRPTEPVYVEPGDIYVLGDNTFDSRDSRHNLRFTREDVVGQPWAVVGPWSRRRWLR